MHASSHLLESARRRDAGGRAMAFVLTPLVVVAHLLPHAAAAAALLDLDMRPFGGVDLRMNGTVWLSGDEISVCDDGRCYAKHAPRADSSLLVVSRSTTTGTDILGPYNTTVISWAPADQQAHPLFETSLRKYSGQLYVLGQRWPRGCTNCSGAVGGDANDIISAFPTWRPAADALRRTPLNFLNWGGNQLCDSTFGRWNLSASSVLMANRSARYPPAPVYKLHACNYTYQGKCPLDYPYFNGTWVGGAQHGAPLTLYDKQMRTVVISPLTNFLVAQHTMSRRLARCDASGAWYPGQCDDPSTLPWAAGLGGLITDLPAGFEHETVVVAGQGVRKTMRTWGDVLLKAGGKIRPNWDRADDLVLSHIGYWTDRGSYYYGHPGESHPEWSMERTLKAVWRSLKSQDVPVQYFQLDDWWFQQTNGDFGGMYEWRPCHQTINGSSSYCSGGNSDGRNNFDASSSPIRRATGAPHVSVFPSGALNFLDGNPPLALYMGLISNTTVYAKANGGSYDMVIDGAFAMPTTPDFYRDLFVNATRAASTQPGGDSSGGLGASRMVLFEQDFLSYWMNGAGAGPWHYTLASATAGAEFLQQQNDAALEVGAKIQFCMNLPCTILQSTRLQAVSQAREAKDHVRDPLVYSWKEGLSGLLLDSVGLGASVDNIFTTGPAASETGCGGFNCTEMNPRYETALAALSGGPYAIGDKLGKTDKEMVMHSCRTDGAILRTTEQLAMLDAGLQAGFDDLEEFDVWSAATILRTQRWVFVLSTFLPSAVELTPADLGYDPDAELLAWDKWSSLGTPGVSGAPAPYDGELRRVGATTPLRLRACPHLPNPRQKNWIYTIVAPRPCAGCWTLIGEINKVASVSGVRFSVVTSTRTSLTVHGTGVPGEVLSLGAVAPAAKESTQLKISVASVVVNASAAFSFQWR